jgi:hypothetical protein
MEPLPRTVFIITRHHITIADIITVTIPLLLSLFVLFFVVIFHFFELGFRIIVLVINGRVVVAASVDGGTCGVGFCA